LRDYERQPFRHPAEVSPLIRERETVDIYSMGRRCVLGDLVSGRRPDPQYGVQARQPGVPNPGRYIKIRGEGPGRGISPLNQGITLNIYRVNTVNYRDMVKRKGEVVSGPPRPQPTLDTFRTLPNLREERRMAGMVWGFVR